MNDDAKYWTMSSRVMVGFITACPNKPTRLVFGRNNNYLESVRPREGERERERHGAARGLQVFLSTPKIAS